MSAYLQLEFDFFSFFLRRREENKVVFGSAESIQEAGLSLWESREINFLLLPGESVMSFLNNKKYVTVSKEFLNWGSVVSQLCQASAANIPRRQGSSPFISRDANLLTLFFLAA